MSQPVLEILPLRPAIRSDTSTTLDVLIRITPASLKTIANRPKLNVGLVIDRSGSMASEKKINYAREAAAFVVRELAPTDRVSLTIFDHEVETPAPNALAEDRSRLLHLIEGVFPRGNTALHAGWTEGARQVGENLVAGGLNRVLLLSDGLANVGEARPDAIGADVHARLAEGVSTTTLGLGNDYNEDLLEGMARSGDGNYYYIENPDQLPAIFRSELQGLAATTGTNVTLAVVPGPGVVVSEVLNELDRTPDGQLKLSNLVAGWPAMVVVRLTVPAATGEQRVCAVELAWSPPGEATRFSATVGLTLPSVDGSAWQALAPDLDVQERTVLLLVARLKKAATQALEHGDAAGARKHLADARALLASVPETTEIGMEIQSVAEIDARIERGEYHAFLKHTKYEMYARHRGRPYNP